MTTCHRKFLEQKCRQRGYSLDEVMPCVVSQDGDIWTIDTDHPSYPAQRRLPPPQEFVQSPPPPREPIPPPPPGPGTELKKLLKTWLRIEASPTCSCNARARRMDEEEAKSPGWCEAHLDEIVGWLREEAARRKLPFVDMAARLLVKRAIANARKAEAARARGSSRHD